MNSWLLLAAETQTGHALQINLRRSTAWGAAVTSVEAKWAGLIGENVRRPPHLHQLGEWTLTALDSQILRVSR
jgi:hypothetical protein